MTIASRNPIDWITLAIYLSLLIIGWMMLYAVVHDPQDPYSFINFKTEIGKQSIWILISLVVFLLSFSLGWKFWNTIAYPLYALSIVLLLGVLIFGAEIKGAKSWFQFGFVSFQPSELAKLGTCLALSSYLSFNKSELKNQKILLTTLLLIALPVLLIFLQPDPGSGIVFASFFILLFRRGLASELYIIGFSLLAIFIFSLIFNPYTVAVFVLLFSAIFILKGQKFPSLNFLLFSFLLMVITIYIMAATPLRGYAYVLPLTLIIVFSIRSFLARRAKYLRVLLPSIALAIGLSYGARYSFENFLKPHQQERINVWLRPDKCDPRGSLYNILQSKLAIGSGGIMGKGYLKGDMTKLNYVPEQTTDFIFSTIGEEQGFIGSISIIILFLILITRMIILAERAKFEFIRNFGYCVAGIFFIHFFINIGMTVGLMPVIGIPLPFISKGGSSLLIFSMMVGILLRMDLVRAKLR